ncbi:hypothetical protein ACKWTF_015418 [Chironomus riparius]
MIMVKFCLLFITMMQSFQSMQSIDINCTYNTSVYYYLGEIYQCEVQYDLWIASKELAVISLVNDDHKSGKSNDDVLSFHAFSKHLIYFPRGLEKIFKNLKRIGILSDFIKEISQEDLKPYPQLVTLNLVNNDILILEEGTFAYNPDLAVVDLENNKLLHIDPGVFSTVSKLIRLFLASNTCFNQNIQHCSSTELSEFIKDAENSCKHSEFIKVKQTLSELRIMLEFVIPENLQIYTSKINQTELTFKNSKFKFLSSIKDQIMHLQLIHSSSSFFNANSQLLKLKHRMMSLKDNKTSKYLDNSYEKLDELLQFMTNVSFDVIDPKPKIDNENKQIETTTHDHTTTMTRVASTSTTIANDAIEDEKMELTENGHESDEFNIKLRLLFMAVTGIVQIVILIVVLKMILDNQSD